MERIPIYLMTLLVALAHMGTSVYKVNAWNLGTVKAEPWRTKTSNAGAPRVVGALRRLCAYLWRDHRQLVTAAAMIVALLLVAPEAPETHGLAAVAIAGQVNIQELQRQYEEARLAALDANERGDRAKLAEVVPKAMALKRQLEEAQGNSRMTAEIDRLTGGMSGGGRGGRSIGQQIIDSEMGKWLTKNRGKFPTGAWTSPASELMAATITSDGASGGDLIITDHQPGIQPLPTRPLTVADLLAPGTTDSNSVGYMQEESIINAAATVAEGAAKPESTIVFTAVTDPVRKIATWIPVVEEMLEDVPALRAYLDTRLRLFVQLTEDDQLLNGDGIAPNFSGILDRAIAASIAKGATENNADVILRQISAIETAQQLPVSGIVMHPSNWLAMLLLKDDSGNYIAGGGPFEAPQAKTLWGRPVAVTTAITLGTALVGAFKTAGQFFRKGGLRVEASNSHASFFVENKVAIRAEERGALAVYRPAAFGLVTALAVPA